MSEISLPCQRLEHLHIQCSIQYPWYGGVERGQETQAVRIWRYAKHVDEYLPPADYLQVHLALWIETEVKPMTYASSGDSSK